MLVDGLARAAQALAVTADFLLGLTDDPAGPRINDLSKRLAQLYLTRRHPDMFGEPGLADDPRRLEELDRKIDQVASELMVLHRDADIAIRRALADAEPPSVPRSRPPIPVEGVGPVRDRDLAELLVALVRHWKALGTRYARDAWVAGVYRWCPELSTQRSALSAAESPTEPTHNRTTPSGERERT